MSILAGYLATKEHALRSKSREKPCYMNSNTKSPNKKASPQSTPEDLSIYARAKALAYVILTSIFWPLIFGYQTAIRVSTTMYLKSVIAIDAFAKTVFPQFIYNNLSLNTFLPYSLLRSGTNYGQNDNNYYGGSNASTVSGSVASTPSKAHTRAVDAASAELMRQMRGELIQCQETIDRLRMHRRILQQELSSCKADLDKSRVECEFWRKCLIGTVATALFVLFLVFVAAIGEGYYHDSIGLANNSDGFNSAKARSSDGTMSDLYGAKSRPKSSFGDDNLDSEKPTHQPSSKRVNVTKDSFDNSNLSNGSNLGILSVIKEFMRSAKSTLRSVAEAFSNPVENSTSKTRTILTEGTILSLGLLFITMVVLGFLKSPAVTIIVLVILFILGKLITPSDVASYGIMNVFFLPLGFVLYVGASVFKAQEEVTNMRQADSNRVHGSGGNAPLNDSSYVSRQPRQNSAHAVLQSGQRRNASRGGEAMGTTSAVTRGVSWKKVQ